MPTLPPQNPETQILNSCFCWCPYHLIACVQLRVEHPAQRYKQIAAGTVAIDAEPVKVRFYDRVKGRVFMHPASINFNGTGICAVAIWRADQRPARAWPAAAGRLGRAENAGTYRGADPGSKSRFR